MVVKQDRELNPALDLELCFCFRNLKGTSKFLASADRCKFVVVYLQYAVEFSGEHHIALGLEISAHESLLPIKLSYERP